MPLPNPFDEHGQIKPECINSVIVALLLKLGGTVEVTWEEMQRTNGRGFWYPMSDTGIVFTVDQPDRHVGHC